LITGGRETGGVTSFVTALEEGFRELGVPAEVIPPSQLWSRRRDLRDASVLKILSTSAILAAPFARRAICVAHGIPAAGQQGWRRFLALVCGFKLADRSAGTQIVCVSHFVSIHLKAVFNISGDGVIHNPLKPLFLEPFTYDSARTYITYAGRLVEDKNLHHILPAILEVLREEPGLRVCLIGNGDQKARLQSIAAGHPRIEFRDTMGEFELREWLRKTRLYISGNQIEALGISYLEALSQGCIVAMPASGGGLEIATDKLGRSVHLFPLSWATNEVIATLRRALAVIREDLDTSRFASKLISEKYLEIDARFLPDGSRP
jgi:glycosyltransferase involved in cell wall biosynthesis